MSSVSNPYTTKVTQNYSVTAGITNDLPLEDTVLMEQNCNVSSTRYNSFTAPRGCHVVQVYHRRNYGGNYTLTVTNTDNNKVWVSNLASGGRVYIGVTPGKHYNLKIQTYNHACIIYYSVAIEQHTDLTNTDY